jgi:maleylpyruvate isomerase
MGGSVRTVLIGHRDALKISVAENSINHMQGKSNMKLFEDKISSAASRVKIALALKGLSFEKEQIGILGADALNRKPEYLSVNPQGLVPALLTDDDVLITQSLAIVEYLDERYPEPALLPAGPEARAIARSIAIAIAAEIHALLPPRVAVRLSALPGFEPKSLGEWNRHWISEGLTAVDALIAKHGNGKFSIGDKPSIADIFLFPQAINAERAGISLDQWPHIAAVISTLRDIPAFMANAPTPRT